MELFARVAVKAAVFSIDRPFDYRVPEEMRGAIAPGSRVVVPFGAGNKKTEGFVLALSGKTSVEKVKPVHKLLDEAPILDEKLLKLALWLRDRVYCTFYEAARAMLPAGLWYSFDETCSLLPGLDRDEALELVNGDARTVLQMLFVSGGTASRADIEAALGGRDAAVPVKTLCAKGLCESSVKPRRKSADKTMKMVSLAVSPEEAGAYVMTRPAPKQKAVLEFLRENGAAAARDIQYFTGAGSGSMKALSERGLIYFSETEVFRRPKVSSVRAAEITLNEEQKAVFDKFAEKLDARAPACALLHGVTGSGKTSVYIKLIGRAIDLGGTALVLVPEIALTPQLMEQFSAHFGDRVAILHSGLALGERTDEFKRIKAGLVDVVVGTRSAVFAPLDDIRLIVLDEEHETTYKSENTPRYHARDVAKFRCVQYGALLVLGSATPSIESAYAAAEGRFVYGELTTRYNERGLPKVEIIDMKNELRQGNGSTISRALRSQLTRNISNGEQSILFLNRRGASNQLICGSCGHVPGCPRCSISLVEHSANGRMMCHLCGYSEKAQRRCGICGDEYRPVGAGTQRVMDDLAELFPGVTALRMDADTTAGKGAHSAILDRFRNQRIPILVGTQMVTKGLDFENVTLVGVLAADGALYAADYRAHERTFAQITQVVGRAGRGLKPGRAVIQTFHPEHPVLLTAATQDYKGFYNSEIELRREQGLPPFGGITRLTLFGMEQDAVMRACMRAAGWLSRALAGGQATVRILGPSPARVLRVNMRYRYQINLLGEDNAASRRLVAALLTDFAKDKQNKGVHIYADQNPMGG